MRYGSKRSGSSHRVGVAVAGAEVHLDDRAGGDVDAAQLDVLRHEPAEDRIGRLPADGFVDGAPQQLAVVADGVEQRRLPQQPDQQDAELAPGRARARGEDEAGEAVDLVVGEEMALAVFFDLALDELGDHVVLRIDAAILDDPPQHGGRALVTRRGVVHAGRHAVARCLRGTRTPPRG